MKNKYSYKAARVKHFNEQEQSEYNAIMGVLVNSESYEEIKEAINCLHELNERWHIRSHGVSIKEITL